MVLKGPKSKFKANYKSEAALRLAAKMAASSIYSQHSASQAGNPQPSRQKTQADKTKLDNVINPVQNVTV